MFIGHMYTSAIVGALACQKDSFLKTLVTQVVSCKDYVPILTSKDKQNKGKKAPGPDASKKQYAVVLRDTVLFPEGGGQPSDKGHLITKSSHEVLVEFVVRDKLTAVHVTEEPLEEGAEVKVVVDWNRRLDIMQQHTGQHLISAIFDTYGLETLSWSMGDMINYIELPRKVEDTVLAEVLQKANTYIVENKSISVTTPDSSGKEVDLSNIPDDYDISKGVVRVVKIGDIDANPCCGTHLKSTGQVQAVSFLHQTNIRGGNSRLHFLCGSRVAQQLSNYHRLLKDVLGNQLSCQIEEVVSKVSELNQNYKSLTSRESNLLKELAAIRAREVFEEFKNNERNLATVYREDNSSEYMTLFQKELSTLINAEKSAGVSLSDSHTIALLNGGYKGGMGGLVKIVGPKAEEIQQQLKQLLKNMKGGGKGASFQGKITKYEKGEVEQVLRYLDSLSL